MIATSREAPNEKWLADITEFQIPAGKVLKGASLAPNPQEKNIGGRQKARILVQRVGWMEGDILARFS
ncbi:hypothetical protein FHX05_005407 [Rhizobium sp. BK491]|nr:hypothetical protein [Rhizobium sp. BK491]MBB3571267.1 hypothetical protein [Rhizobium sp. BK491]